MFLIKQCEDKMDQQENVTVYLLSLCAEAMKVQIMEVKPYGTLISAHTAGIIFYTAM